ncbi:shieldin complex subunit 2 [Syngnathus acus]|uniref:shieldin complex subunit 2 n=1 Tax=Syngnathus acus TaxID=161584 RepID=UPI001885C7F6|nr:shieldin complex subunit 2 [Syngnathus acus]
MAASSLQPITMAACGRMKAHTRWLLPQRGFRTPSLRNTPQEMNKRPSPLSLVSQYLSTSFLRGAAQAQPKYVQRRADHSSGAPERFSLTTCSLEPTRPLSWYLPQDELLSAARRSPEGSGETVGLAQRAERGGVVLETTSYGVLCSQQAGRPASSPASKRARLGEAIDGRGANPFPASPKLLGQCAEAKARYRVLVAVVHPCQLKEIKVKCEAVKGSPVSLASVVVTDQSGVDLTVLLWRQATFWAAALGVGDVVFITGMPTERHAVASVEWANSLKGALLLWGLALDWLPGIRTHQDAVWDVRFLLVMEGTDFERAELHSTPWSHARRLDATDHRLDRFLCVTGRTVEMDVDTLLLQQYSGDVLLRVRVLAFRFRPYGGMAAALPSSLDGSTPRAAISAMLSGDVTYLGCSRCVAELDVDANGIYAPCYVCLPAGAATTGGRHPQSGCADGERAGLQAGERSGSHRRRAEDSGHAARPATEERSDGKNVDVAVERLRTLLCLPGKNVAISVRSLVLCDNNGAAISQELALLELLFVPDL